MGMSASAFVRPVPGRRLFLARGLAAGALALGTPERQGSVVIPVRQPRGRAHLLSEIHVQGEVRHAYCGTGANHIGGRVSVELDCHKLRRAFIAYAARHADVTIRASANGAWPGSNGLVALVCPGASLGNVEHVRVRIDVSGDGIHGSYVRFYHQGPQREGAILDRNLARTSGALPPGFRIAPQPSVSAP